MNGRLGIDGRKTDWRKGRKRIKIGKICDVGKGDIEKRRKRLERKKVGVEGGWTPRPSVTSRSYGYLVPRRFDGEL